MHSQKYAKLKHIKVLLKLFLQFFAIIFLISFEMLVSNIRCIWLNCKMLINLNIFLDLAIIFSITKANLEDLHIWKIYPCLLTS